MKSFNHKRCILLLVLLFIIPLSSFNDKHIETISIRMEKRSLHKGRATVTVADIYFKSENGEIIKNYIKPEGQVTVTNIDGEIIVYNKETNKAYTQENPEYNTEDNILFFILSKNVANNKFIKLGYQLISNQENDNTVVTKWLPPQYMQHLFSFVELRFKDNLPYMASYFDKNEKVIIKTYFTDYESYRDLTIPHTLTEFIYLNQNDSIINRVRFNEVKINDLSESHLFDFELPNDVMQ